MTPVVGRGGAVIGNRYRIAAVNTTRKHNLVEETKCGNNIRSAGDKLNLARPFNHQHLFCIFNSRPPWATPLVANHALSVYIKIDHLQVLYIIHVIYHVIAASSKLNFLCCEKGAKYYFPWKTSAAEIVSLG